MADFSSWSALERAIKKEMKKAVQGTINKSYEDAKKNVKNFYSKPGNPTSVACPPPGYDRTGRLGESVEKEIYPDGNAGEVRLDTDYTYKPSGISTQAIYNLAENDGLLGRGGFWKETKEDVKQNINEEFGKRFSK